MTLEVTTRLFVAAQTIPVATNCSISFAIARRLPSLQSHTVRHQRLSPQHPSNSLGDAAMPKASHLGENLEDDKS
jgi:hypothetical protein